MNIKNNTPDTELNKLNQERPHPMLGRQRSQKFKDHMSQVMTEYWEHNPSRREALQKKVRHIESGEEFESMTQAAEEFNLDLSTVSYHCNGRFKKPKFEIIKA